VGLSLKIEVWSDFVCPFCYIGKRRLEEAISQFEHKDQVEVEFKAFELDPNSPIEPTMMIHESLAKKYGMSVEEAKRANENMAKQAASVGLDFRFDEMMPSNTFDAHRLAKYAKTVGKEKELTEKLLYAYFTENKQLAKKDVLVEVAESVGIDSTETLNVLDDKTLFANDVRIDETIAQQYKITGVPFFVVNNKYGISGAQPLETFKDALEKVWEEENVKSPLQTLTSDGAGVCTDDGCEIPEK
jgi:predicted DsbA family dithiol-disulfide isomerase